MRENRLKVEGKRGRGRLKRQIDRIKNNTLTQNSWCE